MSFITYSNNQPGIKHLKFYKEAIALVQGVKLNPKMDLCDIKIPFDQYDSTSFILGKNVKNKKIDFSTIGNSVITFIVKATYDNTNIDTLNNYVNYVLDGDLGPAKVMSKLMILTGTANRPVPNITFSNPNENYDVKIDILSISVNYVNADLPDYNLVISGLSFNSIRTLTQGDNIGIYDNNNNILQIIQLSNISNIGINGNIVEIDDASNGIIGLQFNTEYDSRQGFSAINWLINDTANRTLPQSADITSPNVVYKNNIVLDVVPNTELADYPDGFTKADAIDLCINYINDTRDGAISLSELLVSFNQNDLTYNQINVTGTYYITFKISDLAGNETVKIVQITFI